MPDVRVLLPFVVGVERQYATYWLVATRIGVRVLEKKKDLGNPVDGKAGE